MKVKLTIQPKATYGTEGGSEAIDAYLETHLVTIAAR